MLYRRRHRRKLAVDKSKWIADVLVSAAEPTNNGSPSPADGQPAPGVVIAGAPRALPSKQESMEYELVAPLATIPTRPAGASPASLATLLGLGAAPAREGGPPGQPSVSTASQPQTPSLSYAGESLGSLCTQPSRCVPNQGAAECRRFVLYAACALP